MKLKSLHLILIPWLLFSAPAWACKFIVAPIKQNLSSSSFVFVGKIIKPAVGMSETMGKPIALFEILSPVKGDLKKGDKFAIMIPETSCGLKTSYDQIWFVIAFGNPPQADYPGGSLLLSQFSKHDENNIKTIRPFVPDIDAVLGSSIK